MRSRLRSDETAWRRFLARQRDPEQTQIYQLWAIGILESYLRKRPARLPSGGRVPDLADLEVPALHPLQARLADEAGKRWSEVVLFCAEHCPDWWRAIPAKVTLVLPDPVAACDGARVLHADWVAADGAGLPDCGRDRAWILAVFLDPSAGALLTPAYASDS